MNRARFDLAAPRSSGNRSRRMDPRDDRRSSPHPRVLGGGGKPMPACSTHLCPRTTSAARPRRSPIFHHPIPVAALPAVGGVPSPDMPVLTCIQSETPLPESGERRAPRAQRERRPIRPSSRFAISWNMSGSIAPMPGPSAAALPRGLAGRSLRECCPRPPAAVRPPGAGRSRPRRCARVVVGLKRYMMRCRPCSSSFRASGNFLLLMSGIGKSLPRSAPGQLLQRPGVGHDVHAAAHQQVADHRPGRRVVDHLVDADLVRPRAALQEEVVQQVELEVAAGEDVAARSTDCPSNRPAGLSGRWR